MPLPPLPLLDALESGLADFDRDAFVDAHQLAPPVSVRLNPAKPSGAFSNAEKVPWCTDGRYLAQRPLFTLDPLLHAGAYYVQEASSQVLHHVVKSVLPEQNGLRVLDLCAAPGGKSTLLASLLPDDAVLLCNEVIRTRVPLLTENVIRWGAPQALVSSADPRGFGQLPGLFHLMVVDAPCSGSGLFRKDPEALQHWSEEAVRMCADRQRRILADAWPCLAQDGLAVYATCSFSPEEDEAVLDWMIEALGAEPVAVPMPAAWGFSELRTGKGGVGYKALPHKLRGEGFFIAAVRKKEGADARVARGRQRSLHDPKIFAGAKHLLADADWRCLPAGKDEWCAVRPASEAFWQELNSALRIALPGLVLGAPSAKGWIPSHQLALSTARSPDIPAIEATREEALLFLKREDPKLTTAQRGWHLVNFEGLSLGWVKAIEGRLNNYLPKEARIRMRIDE